MFKIWEPVENKKRLIEYLIHGEHEEDGTLILLSDDVQDKLNGFLNENGIIDMNNSEAEEYLYDLSEEFEKYF